MATPPKPIRSASVDGFIFGGVGGGSAGGKKWDMILGLRPWRAREDADVVRDELRIEIPISEPALSRWMGRLKDGMAVRVHVRNLRWDPKWLGGSWTAAGALPVRTLPPAQLDSALRAARRALDAPVLVRNSILGRMTLEREYNWYSGRRRFNGSTYEVTVDRSGKSDDLDRDRRDLDRAAKDILRMEKRMPAILKAIAAELLPLYNETWRDENAPELDAKEFLRRIRITSAGVLSRGGATLYFNDGNLFLGHAIDVALDRRGAVKRADLAG